jgi:DHA1 family multidrug resistance protein-like MFS transporter
MCRALTPTSHDGAPEQAEAPKARASDVNSAAAALMTFAAFLGLGFVIPFLPLFVEELGVADPADAAQWAGLLIGIGPLLAGLLAPLWGALADRNGYKRIALLALSALGLSQILTSFARNPIDVLILRVVAGLFGGIGPLGLAMASAAGPKEKASSHIGKIQAAQILAAGFGPLLGGATASALGIRAAFWAAAFCCFFAATVVAIFYREPSRPESESARAAASADPRATPTLLLVALATLVFFANFASRSFTPILPSQLRTFGVEAQALAVSTGLLISIYSVAAAASSFAFGKLAASRDPFVLLTGSLALSLVAALAMGRAGSYEAFLAIGFVYGLVSGGTLTLGYSIGARRFDETQRGASFGKLSGAALAGGAVAPSIAAWAARGSLDNVYWMNAAIYLALAFCAAVSIRRN